MLESLFTDFRGTIIFFLLALPGRLLAISAHEAAHGWMAERCGDPTARMLGRITLNPLKHLDPVGALCMLIFGIGWARPVPVNPRNFRSYRRDDLLVSIAGVTMNIILFLLGMIAAYMVIAVALSMAPVYPDLYQASGDFFRTELEGVSALVSGEYAYRISDLMRFGLNLTDVLIVPAFGQMAGYVYDMLAYFVMTNLVLAVFNLIPLPPLDGYHVLNDLILKGRLFATGKVQAVSSMILYLAMFTGVLGEALNWVYSLVLTGAGNVAAAVFRAFGLF